MAKGSPLPLVCTSPLVERPVPQNQIDGSFQPSDGLNRITSLGWVQECRVVQSDIPDISARPERLADARSLMLLGP